jgi:hypothetical protein
MSTVKLHVLARFPRDYNREQANAHKRFHAIQWMRQHKPEEAVAMHGYDGLLNLAQQAVQDCLDADDLTGGA